MFAPASVAFGDVPKGGEVAQSVTVTNNGPDTLAIDGSQPITGPEAAEFRSGSGCNLPPGQTCQVGVTFSPRSVGPATASLTLETSDGPLGPIPLSGTGTPNPVIHSLTVGDLRLAFKTPTVGVCVVRQGRSTVKLAFGLTARRLPHGARATFNQAVFSVRTPAKHVAKTVNRLPASYVLKLGGPTQGSYRVKLTVGLTETVRGAPKPVIKTITAQYPLCPAF
jgi:hypothetical protein